MKLVHASITENNNAGWDGNAVAGDQTGKEVCVVGWYSSPWDIMIRYPDKNVALKASSAAVKLANSNLVGYDQSERNTLYQALKENGFDIDAYIKSGKKTECDCSSFVYAVYACFVPAMRQDGNAPTTVTMRRFYKNWGFKVSTKNEYLQGKNLEVGDIMVNETSHTAMVTNGLDNVSDTQTVPVIEIPSFTPEVNLAINVLAYDVIRGKWGNGNERKEKLYVAIQTRVNELVKAGTR